MRLLQIRRGLIFDLFLFCYLVSIVRVLSPALRYYGYMSNISDQKLIQRAAVALNPQNLGDFYVADVACALISENGEIFTGTDIGTYLGICAEQSAVSNMVQKSAPKISKIVAVWKDEHGELFVIPPCGRCREFLRVMSQDNLEADIILGTDHVVKLKDLLPHHGWHAEKVQYSH